MTLITIGEIAGSLNTQSVTVRTFTAGTYNARGQFVESGPAVDIPDVTADVQPASGRTLEIVPEGERVREHVSVWFINPVETVQEGLSTRAARLIYRGTLWKCVAVPEDWRENGFVECLFQNTKKAP
jgi:hypothetical protein